MSNSFEAKDFYGAKDSDELYENAKTFAGRTVEDYKAGQTGDKIYRFRSDYENDQFEAHLKEFLSSDQASQAIALVIGAWSAEEMYDTDPKEVIAILKEYKDTLSQLKALYLGDVVSEENEMSWIQQTDISPLFEIFPNLEYLRSRGSQGLQLTNPSHEKLRALAIESGGLDISVLRSVSTGHFPELEHLELWLGIEDYQGNCTVQDLQPILSGTVFPKLKYLGIRNYQYIDEVCSVIVSAPVLQRLEVLDLSLGILTDVGAKALLKLPTDTKLQRLILNYHFISDELVEQLKALPFEVEIGDLQTEDEWRYVAVGE